MSGGILMRSFPKGLNPGGSQLVKVREWVGHVAFVGGILGVVLNVFEGKAWSRAKSLWRLSLVESMV